MNVAVLELFSSSSGRHWQQSNVLRIDEKQSTLWRSIWSTWLRRSNGGRVVSFVDELVSGCCVVDVESVEGGENVVDAELAAFLSVLDENTVKSLDKLKFSARNVAIILLRNCELLANKFTRSLTKRRFKKLTFSSSLPFLVVVVVACVVLLLST